MKLYLIPCTLSDTSLSEVIPCYVLEEVIPSLKVFMVENLRTARRFLKKVNKDIIIDDLHFQEIGKNIAQEEIITFFNQYNNNHDIGLLSEAGCPAVADPGSELVAMAHRQGMEVVPLVGPSSILLSLMASGFSGQSFVFHGYLPVKNAERVKALRYIEKQAHKLNQAQIFIETPFRNRQLLDAILSNLNRNTLLCIASNLTATDELIVTKPISGWKNAVPDLHKKPTIFLIGR